MTTATHAQPFYRFEAPADWVDVAAPDAAPRSTGARAESTETLLFDRQINVTATGDEYYQRLATRVQSAVGVDEYSGLDFVVDPSFQTLDIHWLTIVRDGVAIDQRPTARITELAQETDLRDRIYNGRYTINVLLADVRPGDVVDYAYTLRSRENLFPGHFYERLDLGWSQPVVRQRVRIRSPAARALRYRSSDGSAVPEPRVRGGIAELTLESRDLPAVAADSSVPGWYSVWPYLEVGDYAEWHDVVEGLGPLYAQSLGGARVDEVVAAVRAAGGSAEDQALRALQWVQEEIRYTSISIGRGSHEPTAPNIVIERRYGDCKDKSLLLVTVLEALGIDADVALVHSWRGRALDEALPAPYVFDHAIVRAEIGATVYWLDPTRPKQYGPLSVARSPSFAFALVIDGETQGLEAIPKPGANVRQRDILVELDARQGVEAPATLDITTRYFGALADSMRPALLGSTPEQLQTNFASYVARYYPTAKVRETLAFDDDTAGNVLEVRERYSLDAAFVANDGDVIELALHADELYSYGEPLGAGSRLTPLALEYPIRVRQRVIARLPESWPVTEENRVVDNPAFRYTSAVQYAANTLTLTYDYQALDDYVPASAVARYEADRARMYDDLGYVLTYDADRASGIPTAVAPLPMLVLLLTFAGSVWLAVTLGYRYDPEPSRTDPEAPQGIAGWLLLPALGVVITPFVVGWVIVQWLPFIGAAEWAVLPSLVTEAYRGTVYVVVLTSMAAMIALMVASALGLWLFVTKRTSAPAFFVALEWLAIVTFTAFVAWAVASGLDEETNAAEFAGETTRDIVSACIWTAYMLSSRRVKATFVRRRPVA